MCMQVTLSVESSYKRCAFTHFVFFFLASDLQLSTIMRNNCDPLQTMAKICRKRQRIVYVKASTLAPSTISTCNFSYYAKLNTTNSLTIVNDDKQPRIEMLIELKYANS